MAVTDEFTLLARRADAPLDRLSLALAAQFRPVDYDGALRRLDALGAELRDALGTAPGRRALVALLAERHGFHGIGEPDEERPDDAMLDVVLERRCGPPELLAVVYQEVARRAGLPVWGVGLRGHFVVAYGGAEAPIVLDPFREGCELPPALAPAPLRRCTAHQTVLRVLDILVAGYARRADLSSAIRAAELRLALPVPHAERVAQQRDLIALRARLN